GLAAGVVVLMASTAPVPRLRRHLSIYAPEAHAVTVERIAVDTDVTVVAVPREDLDDVDVTHLSGERTRAVVDMTNSWEDNVLAPALARDGLSDSAALRRAWHEAGLEAPIVRAFFDVSHHVLADAGRAAVVAGPGGGSAAASEARQSLCVGADDADAGALIARLVTAMGFEARRCSLDEAKAHEPAAG
ncbi:MAG: DNA-binding protein, partial [Micrococcus sp.]|nr:DNA-binding protein [Micrococcus sp.]